MISGSYVVRAVRRQHRDIVPTNGLTLSVTAKNGTIDGLSTGHLEVAEVLDV
ncbi:MAG: hypothetical protein ACYTGL_28750 [Planctomycetota bacterium]